VIAVVPAPVRETVWSGAVLVMFSVPEVVIGLPDTLIPVPAVAATDVTVPVAESAELTVKLGYVPVTVVVPAPVRLTT
jgi:hypothetical protein